MHSKIKLKNQVKNISNKPGVYLFKDYLQRIIYIGKAKNLKKRVLSYFQFYKNSINRPKINSMIEFIFEVQVIEVKNNTEAIFLENKLIKEWKPKYNTLLTDDKNFLMIYIDLREEMPRFKFCRFKSNPNFLYFGPFHNASAIRNILYMLQRKFNILLGNNKPKAINDGFYLLYTDARSEIYENENKITKLEYRKRVQIVCQLLKGRIQEWLIELKQRMKEASDSQKYESAALIRDNIRMIKETLIPSRKFFHISNIYKTTSSALAKLKIILNLQNDLNYIECFDISHISGSFMVASMVCFKNGYPSKNNYRRYKIKSFIGNDDYKAIKEVINRRYFGINKKIEFFPDLIIIDGGIGQVQAAMKVFLTNNVSPMPSLIGLAKNKETIVFPKKDKTINLKNNDISLHLLQRIRNEAHRFANTYSSQLRRKAIRESLLDELSCINNKKKNALFFKFKSLTNILKASKEEIITVPGFNDLITNKLYKFLHSKNNNFLKN